MATYHRGSHGPEVARIQQRLKDLGHYLGPVDGQFGGGTESAVVLFQRASGLLDDGVVGPLTWQRLFHQDAVPPPALLAESLTYRCLALTGTFETGSGPPECFAGVTGDFDGQGISWGVLQWNFGQGSLPSV